MRLLAQKSDPTQMIGKYKESNYWLLTDIYAYLEKEALDSSFKNHLLIKFDGHRFTILLIFNKINKFLQIIVLTHKNSSLD